MKNWLILGPVRLRIGSKNLAPWGYPRIQIGGLAIWSHANTGQFIPFSFHPKSSITWLWSIWLGRRNMGPARRGVYRHNCGGQAWLRLFGISAALHWQHRVPRRVKPAPSGEFLPDWRERVARDQCPKCDGELDTGWECNNCGFDALLIAQTQEARPNA